MKFYYLNEYDKKKYITLKRGIAEWANLDCPSIYIEGDRSRWDGWVLSNRTVMEDGNEEFVSLLRGFIKKSSEAFFKKYPECFKGQNGFLINFENNLNKYHPKWAGGLCD